MAQHYSIKEWNSYLNVYESICKRFAKVITGIKTSMKFEENTYQESKINSDDKVFNTWRKIKGENEVFEVHYDAKEKKIIDVFLVK